MQKENEEEIVFKYNELEILDRVGTYISSTYGKHYAAKDVQTLDLIMSMNDGLGFLRGNILKYASRYQKKGTPIDDVMKIIHYSILLLHFLEKENNFNTEKE